MKKVLKKLVGRFPRWAKWLMGGFLMWFIWGSLDSIFVKTKLFRSLLVTVPKAIYSIHVPDIFFLISIIAIVYYLAWSFILNRANLKGIPSPKPFVFINNAYWASLSIMGLRAKGPYCPKCYCSTPRKDVLMIITYERAGEFKCPICDFIIQSTEPKFGDDLFSDHH